MRPKRPRFLLTLSALLLARAASTAWAAPVDWDDVIEFERSGTPAAESPTEAAPAAPSPTPPAPAAAEPVLTRTPVAIRTTRAAPPARRPAIRGPQAAPPRRRPTLQAEFPSGR
jgi:hypothetical protein